MPIDINFLREDKGGDPEKWREYQRKRFADPSLVDKVLELDKEWRVVQSQINNARKDVSAVGKEVAAKKKSKQDATEEIERMKQLKEKIPPLETKLKELDQQRTEELNKIANEVDPAVPISKDERDNKVYRKWGECKRPEGVEDVLHHHELLWMIGGYEPERGVAAAGHRAYFLTGPGLTLNLALIQYGLQLLEKKGYTPVQPPYFMNKEVMSGVAQLGDFDEQLYKVSGEKGDDKYLIATSEQPVCSFHQNEWLQPKDLPKKYAGYSTCFRKEAGAHGKDAWGIFRVHQFEKVEQFVLTHPEESAETQELMIKTAEEYYQSLGLSYHVVDIVSGELNNAAARKLDLEAWFPALGEMRELVSCSNCTDYQSRGMNVRLGPKQEDQSKNFVHMLNSTLCATTRTICCILENYQTSEGVKVPEVLVPFCGGKTFFPFVRARPRNLNKEKMERAAAKKSGQVEGQPKKSNKPQSDSAKPASGQEQRRATPSAEAEGSGKSAGQQSLKSQKAPTTEGHKLPTTVKASLSTESGWNALNTLLLSQSYVAGFQPSAEDDVVFRLVTKVLAANDKTTVDGSTYPHVCRWYRHMHSFTEQERAKFPLTKGQILNGDQNARASTLFKE